MIIGAASWLGVAAAAPGHLDWKAIAGGAACAAAAALGPDIDSPRSLASQSLGIPTRILSATIRVTCGGHRKITHCLIGIAVFGTAVILAGQALRWPAWVAVALLAGWCSHIASDMLTEEGCPLLWPLTGRKFHLTPWGLRVRVGLRKIAVKGSKKRRDGTRRKRHTSEWWLIRPAAIVAVLALSVLIALGR